MSMTSRMGELARMEAIEEARVYIAEHYDEAITIDLLADKARLSPKYFGELFKKRFGQSAMDYITEVRIRHAKRYLRETDELLRDIARKVGYSDEFYFSRKFKKEVGFAPSAYLRNSKHRIAVLSPSSIGYLLALGIVPVAAPLDAKWTAYYYHSYASRIPFHLKPGDGDFSEDTETLLKSRPDIVVSHERPSDSGLPDALERSALPLFVPAEQDNWIGKLRRIASFLDKEERCEAWIGAYRHKADLARRDVERLTGKETFVALRLWGNTFHLYCNQGIRDVVYRDLGLNPAYSPPKPTSTTSRPTLLRSTG
ncbi:helix-turn-helix domain-containing protein [Cohnella faecalis]|uniref:Helix-turn-helix domain-containing protein n=2 Tax=Cohnella faecalis TaxID=2315694 RepID=A0A398CMF8_9BACL|nr:helix-turn-helix domain-containing protein [Cohnella faecalis]